MHQRLLALTRNAHFPLALTVLSGLIAGLLTIWQAWLLSTIINSVFLGGQIREEVVPLLVLMLVPAASRALLAWMSEASANEVAIRVKTILRERLFAHITRLGPAFARGERTGELTTTAVEGVEALDGYYSQYLPQLILTGLVPFSILLFVFPIDLLTGVIFVVTAPLIPLFMTLIGKGAEIVTKRQYDTLRILSAHFLDSLQGLTTLKIFGQSKAWSRTIALASEKYRDATLGILRITFLSAFALELLATLSTAIIAVEIGLRLLYGRMEFQPALFLLILAPEFYMPLRALGARFHSGKAGTTAAERIFEILDKPLPSARDHDGVVPANREISSIVLDNVSFTYPDDSPAALQDINLTIRKGEHIALVGKTGAGKTTLVNLLLGFLQPTSGQIHTKFISTKGQYKTMSSNGPPSLLDIAWVPQFPYLFHDTVAANLRLGKINATQEQVIEAAKAAHLHEFILSLPQKYETNIGESGARLSSGQAQRLALARAFLSGAEVLLLDEPTSSLDPETESLLEESTRRLMQNRTVITIAHRLNTVFQADQIVVFDAGRIIEQGTHSELIPKEGAYAGMVKVLKLESITPGKGTNKTIKPEQPLKTLHLHSGVSQLQITSPGEQKNIFLRLISFLVGSWNLVALSIFLGALTIGANISLMGTAAWLISTAALHPSIAALGVAVVGVRFFGLSRAVFRYLERLVSHGVTFRLLSNLRVWFYEKLEPLAPACLIEHRAGDLLARIIGDISSLENFYVRAASPPMVALAVGAATGLFLAAYKPTLAGILAGSFVIIGFVLPLSAMIQGRVPGRELTRMRADLNNQLLDGIQGLADLLAFNRSRNQQAQIAHTGRLYGRVQMRMAAISGFYNGLAVLLTNLGGWMIVYLTIPLVTDHQITGPMLAALTLLTLASFEAVTPLPLAAQLWESQRESARRLFKVIDGVPLVSEAGFQPTGTEENTYRASIEFSDLSFSYPNQNHPALEHISFKVEEGRILAIVGASGAGKSTLANLLLRFWEYESGEIRLGGISLHNLHPEKVRAQYSVVSQRSYLFNTSIRENIRLAQPDATQAEIETAARMAGFHDFIMELPGGYDTRVGEGGGRLSGGERQRLAIARALLKDAPILIMDEPTANLDPVTEKQILDTLFINMEGRTSLFITHRLIGLEAVDEIIVLHAGRIVERGSQDELLSRDGFYFNLWELQNRLLAPGLVHSR
jgi:ATP-binding cassette, subfamily C, bacterial CydCD